MLRSATALGFGIAAACSSHQPAPPSAPGERPEPARSMAAANDASNASCPANGPPMTPSEAHALRSTAPSLAKPASVCPGQDASFEEWVRALESQYAEIQAASTAPLPDCSLAACRQKWETLASIARKTARSTWPGYFCDALRPPWARYIADSQYRHAEFYLYELRSRVAAHLERCWGATAMQVWQEMWERAAVPSVTTSDCTARLTTRVEFAPGSAKPDNAELGEVAQLLRGRLCHLNVVVRGHEGAGVSKQLAEKRAAAVAKRLKDLGVAAARVRVEVDGRDPHLEGIVDFELVAGR